MQFCYYIFIDEPTIHHCHQVQCLRVCDTPSIHHVWLYAQLLSQLRRYFAAAVHEAPKLLHMRHAAGGHSIDLPLSLAAGGVAGVTALLSVWFLMRWFKRHEVKGFDIYAFYCIGMGALFMTIEILVP